MKQCFFTTQTDKSKWNNSDAEPQKIWRCNHERKGFGDSVDSVACDYF